MRSEALRTETLGRRQILKTAIAGVFGMFTSGWSNRSFRDEVDWLGEVQTPPGNIPRDNLGHFAPLLKTRDGRPIRSLSDWKKQRAEIRKAWMKFLGPMPPRTTPVKLEVLRQQRLDKCIRQLVRYESEPGVAVEGYLLRPVSKQDSSRRPGIVALHQTTRDTIEQIAGVTGPEMQQIGLKLAERGFVVFSPRCFLWQNTTNYAEAVAKFKRRHPHTLGMHKMLYDAMRGVDVLASLPGVDRNRIGATGHSLGAKETLYLAAFDERIQAAVASEGGTGLKSTNWDAPWYLGDRINDPHFTLNHHQLLALVAPRPFLILAGETGRGSADGDRSWPYIEAALPVYKLYGTHARIGMYNHRQGHSIPAKAFDRLAQWLEIYLAPRANLGARQAG